MRRGYGEDRECSRRSSAIQQRDEGRGCVERQEEDSKARGGGNTNKRAVTDCVCSGGEHILQSRTAPYVAGNWKHFLPGWTVSIF